MSNSNPLPEHEPGDGDQPTSVTKNLKPADELKSEHTELIGPAGALLKSFPLGDGPIVVLFHGPPGVGKSALCTRLASRLVAPEHIERIIGPNCTVDKLRDLMSTLLMRPLFGEWHVIILDEADKIPSVAQVSILELLDRLPNYCAIFATSNEGERIDRLHAIQGLLQRIYQRISLAGGGLFELQKHDPDGHPPAEEVPF